MLHNRNRNSIIVSLTTVRSKSWYRLLLQRYIFQRASSLNVWGMAAFHTRIKRHRWGSHFWRSLSDSYSAPHLALAAVWAEVQKSPKNVPKTLLSIRHPRNKRAARLPPVTWIELAGEGARLRFDCNAKHGRKATDGASLHLCTTEGHSGVFSVRQALTAKGKLCVMYSCRVFSLLTEQKFAIKAQLVWVFWQ